MVLWGITTYFNPCGYKRRYNNYVTFRHASRKQNLKLITVELAINDSPFVLKDSMSDILIQVRSNSVLWHKEQLLNVAIGYLPGDCDKICWLDCDLVFENDNWVNELSAKLDGPFIFIQPFETITNLNEDHTIGYSTVSYTKAISDNLKKSNKKKIKGTVGFGWAAKLDFIKALGGFYPYNIIGGGDNFVQMILKAANYINNRSIEDLLKNKELSRFNNIHKKHFISYLKTLSTLNVKFINPSRISFINGNVFHLWHGNTRDRQYTSRHDILKNHLFDPIEHISFNSDNCMEWSKCAPKKLQTAIKEYFRARNEDGNN